MYLHITYRNIYISIDHIFIYINNMYVNTYVCTHIYKYIQYVYMIRQTIST